MRRRSSIYAGLAAAVVSAASVIMAFGATPAGAAIGGSGPYPADYETSSTLANHTIFRPQTLPSERLPILVWGNGACSANGLSQGNFLREIASHGFLAIANGAPNGSGSTNAQMLTQSIDWAVAENSRSGSKYYNRLDTTKIAVAGFSCGGLEAYAVSNDPRVTTTGIFSSGLLNDADDYQLRRLTKPIAYFVGGPSDIAYPNAMDDWGKLPSGLPAFMGNLNVGHGGTYDQPNGGEFGRVAVLYLKWRLKGDVSAGCQLRRPGLRPVPYPVDGPAEEPDARRRPAAHHAAAHHATPHHAATHDSPAHHAAARRRPVLFGRLRGPGPVERRVRRHRHRHRRQHGADRLARDAHPAGRSIDQLAVERRAQRNQRHRHRGEPELQRASRRGPEPPPSDSRAPATAAAPPSRAPEAETRLTRRRPAASARREVRNVSPGTGRSPGRRRGRCEPAAGRPLLARSAGAFTDR